MHNNESQKSKVKSKKLQSGVGLIEAMVAMMILTVVTTSVIYMVLSVLALTYSSRLKTQATGYSEQSIEQVREFFQTNGWVALSNKGKNGPLCYKSVWTEFQPATTCVSDAVDPACNISDLAITGTNFYRYFLVETIGNRSVKVTSVVTWKERDVCKPATKLETYFFNY